MLYDRRDFGLLRLAGTINGSPCPAAGPFLPETPLP